MAECSHNCSTCSQKCSKESLLEPQNKASNVKRVIGVVSGKGGVGKSLVTSMLAVTMQRRGYKTAILDADITGPSIPNPLVSAVDALRAATSVCSRPEARPALR